LSKWKKVIKFSKRINFATSTYALDLNSISGPSSKSTYDQNTWQAVRRQRVRRRRGGRVGEERPPHPAGPAGQEPDAAVGDVAVVQRQLLEKVAVLRQEESEKEATVAI
jgi:hypothetical protein